MHSDTYWIPDKPLEPQQSLYYGWSLNERHRFPQLPDGIFSLTMENYFGSPVIETFFLVLPKDMEVLKSNPPSGSEKLLNFSVYWWTKTVQKGENHLERVELIKTESNSTISVQPILKDSFEKGTNGPKGWKKGKAIGGVNYIWDKNNPSSGRASLCFKKTAKKYFPIAQWTKKIPHKSRQKQLSVSAQVKAENATKAILDVLFLDKNNEWIKHEWVSYIGQKKEENIPPADHDWKEYSGSVDIPENTKTIVIGLQMYGPGTVWFDDLAVGYVIESPKVKRKPDKLLAENLTTKGWDLWKQRKLAESEKVFKEAIKNDPEAEGAYQGLGWAQLNQGKKLNAKDSFKKCVEINPKNFAALNGLGWIAHGQGNVDDPIAWWEKAVKAQPGATASLSGLTQVYMERKEYNQAIKYYQMWLKAEPGNKKAKDGLNKAKASIKN